MRRTQRGKGTRWLPLALAGCCLASQAPLPGAQERALAHQSPVHTLCFSPDGGTLVSGVAAEGGQAELVVWNVRAGENTGRYVVGNWPLRSACFSPDGRYLALAGGEYGRAGEVQLWDARGWKPARALPGHNNCVWQAAFSPDGRLLATASADRTVRIWETATGVQRRVIMADLPPAPGEPIEYGVVSVAFSLPDGKGVAAGCRDGAIRVWDVETGALQHTMKAEGQPRRMAYLPGGELVSAHLDGGLRVWESRTGRLVNTYRGHGGPVAELCLSANGERVVTAGWRTEGERLVGEIRVWKRSDWSVSHFLPDEEGALSGVALPPDGRLLASAVAGITEFRVRLRPLP